MATRARRHDKQNAPPDVEELARRIDGFARRRWSSTDGLTCLTVGTGEDEVTLYAPPAAADAFLETVSAAGAALEDAHAERLSEPAAPGTIVARRDGAVLRAAADGGVWIGHAKRMDSALAYKLPVALAFPAEVRALPASQVALDVPFDGTGYREIRYEEEDAVGYLHFPFYNGAMSTAQCERLLAAYSFALARPTHVLVLMGGPDFWSNGIHLNVIEAAESPADESWRNINAIDDVTRAIERGAGRSGRRTWPASRREPARERSRRA